MKINNKIKNIPMISINTMVINNRNIKEVFYLGNMIKNRFGSNIAIDLRSKRKKETDENGIWSFTKNYSNFDILNNNFYENISFLFNKYKIPILSINSYFSIGYEQDIKYGMQVIDNSIKYAEFAHNKIIYIRLFGSNLKLASLLNYRKKIINVSIINDIKKKMINNIINLVKYSIKIEKTCKKLGKNYKIILAFEPHHGCWPESLVDIKEFLNLLYNKMSNYQQHIGIIDDPSNIYLSYKGNPPDPLELYQTCSQTGGRIICCHLKDVKKISSKKNKFKNINFQKVGLNKPFNFSGDEYQWKQLGKGSVKLDEVIENALKYGHPPYKKMPFSTEYVPSTNSFKESEKLINLYCKILLKVYRGMC